MATFLHMIILSVMVNTFMIFDFNREVDIRGWRIVDDIVMGGRSEGSFSLDKNGYGLFKGYVSLENNGGFSSVRYGFKSINTKGFSKVVLRVKGDGKRYQFRIKDRQDCYYAHIQYFQTSGEWEDIAILLKDMYPSFRGRKLDLPNFSEDYIEEISILIANYKSESFELKIDEIRLE
jgi:NADH dehydrogenase [ubiquinone] 1 alpha subcomplex assembly factor 1